MHSAPRELTEGDRRALELLSDFIPDKVFDAHLHLTTRYEEAVDVETYRANMGPILNDPSVLRINAMPWVSVNPSPKALRDEENARLFACLDKAPDCVGSVFIGIDDSEETIEALTAHPGVRALKCYATTAGAPVLNDCAIRQFLPDSAWEVASRKNLPIFLHMQRPAALSDPDNCNYILTMAQRYPDVKLVLSHCARGFAPWTVLKTIDKVAHLENIWFDFSAVCEEAPIAACIMRTAGKRVVWGSDFPVNLGRGRVISINDSFTWMQDAVCDTVCAGGIAPCCVALENLLAVRKAAWLLDLDVPTIEDIFYNNALTLLNLERDS